MNKQYTLIVGHGFSLANNTDSDPQSDYSPGIWSIKTQKSALYFAKKLLAEGDKIQVTDYDNPAYHSLANMFIKELGLDQPLFAEPQALKSGIVTNGKPTNLSQLKKYLTLAAITGEKLIIRHMNLDGTLKAERYTFAKKVQTTSVVFDKAGGNSWMELGKASDWTFSNESATYHYVDREGNVVPSIKIVYTINQ